ncbi:MAG: hypothetical protein U0996_17275 [Planctomycetaceae bacterium]
MAHATQFPASRSRDDVDWLAVTINKAFRVGMVLNGLSDNVYRSSLSHGYQMQLDPAVSNVQIQNTTIRNFDTGVRIKDWVNGLRFKDCDLTRNRQDRSIGNSTATPQGVVFE